MIFAAGAYTGGILIVRLSAPAHGRRTALAMEFYVRGSRPVPEAGPAIVSRVRLDHEGDAGDQPKPEPAPPRLGGRTVGAFRYSTASDGSKLLPMLRSQAVPKQGRRRAPTGYCHAVPWWAPARALCGLLTERMALWPQADFTAQRVEVCPRCRAIVRAEQFEDPPAAEAR